MGEGRSGGAGAVPVAGSGLAGVEDLGLDPLAIVPLVAAGALYVTGVRRLASRGRAWPAHRSVLFGLGLVAMVAATQGPRRPSPLQGAAAPGQGHRAPGPALRAAP
ncbi:MAG: cytochrome c oxidase assembly protein [Acidimicrobiales bacterium]